MPYMLDGRRLSVGRPFTHPDGRQFARNWTNYSTEALTSLGITYEADPEPFDGKYYISSGNPRDVAELKTTIANEQKIIAGQMLKDTDWYVVRKSETDVAIPSNVSTYRAAVRTVCGTREAEIAAVSSTEALEALMKAPDRILDTDGETYIDNPAAHLTPWPELAS